MVPFYAASGAFEPLVAGSRIDLDVIVAQTLATRGFELVFGFHLIGVRMSVWCLFTRRPALESLVAGHRIDLDVKAAQILALYGFELVFEFHIIGARAIGWCLFTPRPARSNRLLPDPGSI